MATAGGSHGVTVHATDPRARSVEELQQTLGEGPGVAASGSGAAVLVPDLSDTGDRFVDRWPTFAAEALAIGIHAAFAFPLLLGTASVGAFSLYRTESGDLDRTEVSAGWATADAVALSLAAQPLASDGGRVGDADVHRDPMRVHQAAGMVTVQLEATIDEALLRMRGIAFAEGRTVDELADDIVERHRRLSKEDT